MNYIFVDLEMNPIDSKYQAARKICTREIIEIGAVMLNEKYQEIDHFKSYVKPSYSNKINKKCKELTGTTDEILYMLEHWHDFQKTFCDLIGLSKPISLQTAIGAIGEKFVGQVHDALWDARNTAYIYQFSKDTKKFQTVMKSVIEFLQPEECSCMLGEVFNINELLYGVS